MDEVRIDEGRIQRLENARPYMWALLGYCDGRVKARRAKVKQKYQRHYNKGYDDGKAIDGRNNT